MITILWWFYIQAMVSLYGAQLNVVLKERLYPRSLSKTPDTDADRRADQAYAKERVHHQREDVNTTVRPRASLRGSFLGQHLRLRSQQEPNGTTTSPQAAFAAELAST